MKTRILITDAQGNVSVSEFDGDNIVIGRIDSVDLVLSHNRVSRKHAIISREDSQYIIGDLGSSNGTIVNGHRISSRYRLAPGDEIKIRPFTLSIDKDCFPVAAAARQHSSPSPQMEELLAADPPDRIKTELPGQKASREERPLTQEHEEQMLGIKNEILQRLLGHEELRKKAQQLINDIITELSSDIPSWMEKPRIAKDVLDEFKAIGIMINRDIFIKE